MRKDRKGLVIKKRCAYCFSTENLTIDHKHPKILGGTDDTKNLQVLCMRCNGTKSGVPHGHLQVLVRWVYKVNEERLARGKTKPLFGKNAKALKAT